MLCVFFGWTSISDLGLNLAYVQAIDENSSQPINGSGYRGKKRIFPAEFKLRGIRPVYKNPENLEFHLRPTGRGKIKAYLSTTKEELNWTLKYLENKGEAFSVVKISYQNGPDRWFGHYYLRKRFLNLGTIRRAPIY